MDFTFSPEQIALRDAVRASRGRSAQRVRAAHGRARRRRGVTSDVWRKIVELGWTALLVPESAGGLGLGLVDGVVVQEEMGRACFPGPYFSSAILATLAARALGLDDQLARSRRAHNAERSHSTKRATAIRSSACAWRANGRGTRYKLDGVKPMVPDGMSADWILVPARTREGLQSFLVERPRTRSRFRVST